MELIVSWADRYDYTMSTRKGNPNQKQCTNTKPQCSTSHGQKWVLSLRAKLSLLTEINLSERPTNLLLGM